MSRKAIQGAKGRVSRGMDSKEVSHRVLLGKHRLRARGLDSQSRLATYR